MAFKNLFDAMKREGYIVKDLDMFLLAKSDTDSDRAIDVNAPSQIGKCDRARYYARTGETPDPNSISARARRIFDNGTGTHERLQKYLKDMGKLLMDELPVHSIEYNIQGHTDGLFSIRPLSTSSKKAFASSVGVLEIKSINNKGFTELKDAKPEHKMQGLTYVYCIEERRKALKNKYDSILAFSADKKNRYKEYAELYSHLRDGHNYTRDEKVKYQCDLHNILDNILIRLDEPVTVAVFLYENKDNQELKEYSVSTTDSQNAEIMDEILKDCAYLNECVKTNTKPPRCATKKTDNACRWCNYKIACWN